MQHVFTGTNPGLSRPNMSISQHRTMNIKSVPPSQAVVERVAACEGVDHTELDPLYEAIDPDAFDMLIESGRHNESRLKITFSYQGYDVTVTGDGVVHLAEDEHIEG